MQCLVFSGWGLGRSWSVCVCVYVLDYTVYTGARVYCSNSSCAGRIRRWDGCRRKSVREEHSMSRAPTSMWPYPDMDMPMG